MVSEGDPHTHRLLISITIVAFIRILMMYHMKTDPYGNLSKATLAHVRKKWLT